MKRIKQITLLFGLTFMLVQLSYGQSKLYGDWTVNCPTEQINSTRIKFCALCPVVQTDKSSIKIKDFELKFDKDLITLTFDKDVTTVQYKWDTDTQSIEFVYKEKTYKFNVLTTGDTKLQILKDQDGLLMTLIKK